MCGGLSTTRRGGGVSCGVGYTGEYQQSSAKIQVISYSHLYYRVKEGTTIVVCLINAHSAYSNVQEELVCLINAYHNMEEQHCLCYSFS